MEKEKINILWDDHTIEELIDLLHNKLTILSNQNDALIETNRKLKEGIWKEEEISRLKQEVKDANRGFPITEEEEKKINEFIDAHTPKQTNGKLPFGAIGGAFQYRFVPTYIGYSGSIVAPNGDELVFHELS